MVNVLVKSDCQVGFYGGIKAICEDAASGTSIHLFIKGLSSCWLSENWTQAGVGQDLIPGLLELK